MVCQSLQHGRSGTGGPGPNQVVELSNQRRLIDWVRLHNYRAGLASSVRGVNSSLVVATREPRFRSSSDWNMRIGSDESACRKLCPAMRYRARVFSRWLIFPLCFRATGWRFYSGFTRCLSASTHDHLRFRVLALRHELPCPQSEIVLSRVRIWGADPNGKELCFARE